MSRGNAFSLWLGIALASVWLCACSGHESSLIELVPSDSCAVIVVDWSSVRNDRDLKRLIKGNEFESMVQRLGIDGSSVNTLVVFSAINAQSKSGLLLRGSIDRETVVSALKDKGWREESVDGHKLYVNGNDYAAMPKSDTLFAGTREGATAVFKAVNDTRDSIVYSASYKKINEAMSVKKNPVRAFLIIPQGTLDMADAALTATSVALSLFDLGGIGQLLKLVNVASGFAFTLSHGTNQMYPVELCVLMRDEKAAAFVSGSLNAMKGLSAVTSANSRDDESVRALQKMSITRNREVLSIKMEMPGGALFPPNAH